jgi:hypothetical protein
MRLLLAFKVNLKSLLFRPLRHIRGVEVQLHYFLTSALSGELLASHPDRFKSRKKTPVPIQ